MTWVYALPAWIFGPLVVLVFCAFAAAGLIVSRRRLSGARLTHNDVAGPVLATVGTLIALMLSFMVVGVWQQWDASAANVAREAAALSDLHHLADALPQPTRNRLKEEVDRYIQVIVHDEWQKMRSGRRSDAAHYLAGDILATVADFQPKTIAQQEVQSQALDQVRTFMDTRRSRLHDNQEGIPIAVWCTMLFLSALTVGLTYFFRVDSWRAHMAMVLIMTAAIASIMVLIAELDYPFRGDVSIRPQAFIEVFERVHNLGVN